jgi:hypothetical protein
MQGSPCVHDSDTVALESHQPMRGSQALGASHEPVAWVDLKEPRTMTWTVHVPYATSAQTDTPVLTELGPRQL